MPFISGISLYAQKLGIPLIKGIATEAIETLIAGWNHTAAPFDCTKQEADQQQIKCSYSNMYN